jgi:5-methylthioribose kinase
MYDLQNSEQLLRYLDEHGFRAGSGGSLRINVLTGGVSCHAVLIEGTVQGNVVLKQALPRLKVAMEWKSDVARIHREALCMRYLHQIGLGNKVTQLLWEDDAVHVIIMTEVPRPHENWKEQLLRGDVNMNIVRQFAMLLASIHRESWQRRDQASRLFEDRQFFESLRLEPYYRFTAQSVPQSAPFYDALISDAVATRLTLVHGDYSPKNVLISASQPILLDHEVAHFGDPAFDVGFAATHLLSKAHHLPGSRERFLEASHEFANSYQEGIANLPWSTAAQPRAVRHTLGCLLARVAGRSPLEYLSAAERTAQAAMVLELMAGPPETLTQLVVAWKEQLSA